MITLTLTLGACAGAQAETNLQNIVDICKLSTIQAGIEQQKVCVELLKAETEKDRLKFDRENKNGRDFWIAIIQVGAAAIAVGVPVWTAVFSARADRKRRLEEQDRDRDQREKNEKLQFQLKAAEIAMAARDSTEVKSKAQILATLFPERLPQDFAAHLDPSKIRFGPGREMRLELLKLLVMYPEKREDLLKIWSVMWPGDVDPNFRPAPGQTYLWLPILMKDPVVGQNKTESKV
jgi:hypothetical protein